jgi:hypothetical protein
MKYECLSCDMCVCVSFLLTSRRKSSVYGMLQKEQIKEGFVLRHLGMRSESARSEMQIVFCGGGSREYPAFSLVVSLRLHPLSM